MKQVFTDRLFVAWEDPVRDDPFLVVTKDKESLAELHERRRVGVYRLEKVIVLVNATNTVTPALAKRRIAKKRKKP